MTETVHGYGWVPDSLDTRDHLFTPHRELLGALPRRVNLASKMRAVWDQGSIGSCTAHGVLAAFLYAARLGGRRDPMLSRLQLYYNSRALEGTAGEDSGAQVRDAIKAAAQGIAPERLWPYVTDRFTEPPPAAAVAGAAANVAIAYQRVGSDLGSIMASLAEGWPIVDGMPVYESMESAEASSTGVVPMPAVGEQILGYHCTLTVGYDLDLGVLIKRNSWGAGWGRRGYFTVPMDYRTFLSDLWRITAAT